VFSKHAKNPKNIAACPKFKKNLTKKYFCMFKNTKSISWILKIVCRIPKDFSLYIYIYIYIILARKYIIKF